jgi:hypothetical protein
LTARTLWCSTGCAPSVTTRARCVTRLHVRHGGTTGIQIQVKKMMPFAIAPIGPQLRTHMHVNQRKAPSQPCVCTSAHICVCAVTRHACPHARVRSVSYNLNRRAAASTWNARFAALLAYPVSPYIPTVRRTVGIVLSITVSLRCSAHR